MALMAVISPAASLAQSIPDNLAQRLKACTTCHGAEGRAATDGFYPRIAGKPAGYLYNQLVNFRDGKRSYPAMRYMVGHMSDAYLKEIAEYFALQHPPYGAPQATEASAQDLEHGRTLVMQGDKSRNLPACVACHGEKMTGIAPFIPGLLGVPRDYLVAQLGAWQTGSRRAHAPDCMQQVAKKLTPQDIASLAAWLAIQNVPTGNNAIAGSVNGDLHLPLSCGSVPR
ncbi:c-type cytochrome [Undibacterium sp. TJN19]